jgi:predicted GNAT family acetyltransferase
MVTKELLDEKFSRVMYEITSEHQLKDFRINIELEELDEDDMYMNQEMYMYADEWYRINIATAKNEVIFTICVCTKLFQSDSNLTYASIQSGFVCPKLEKKGIATKIVGVLDDLREMGFINKVVITDRSDLIDPGITVWDKIFMKYPKLKMEDI